MFKLTLLKLKRVFTPNDKIELLFIAPPLPRFRLAYHCNETGLFPISKAIELISAGICVPVNPKNFSTKLGKNKLNVKAPVTLTAVE